MYFEQSNNFSDRITLKNYILDLEIGAYSSEKDCTQKVKFDVSLDVNKSRGIKTDDVNDILSYEIIVDAIEKVTKGDRINLLEKCAELIAKICLSNSQVQKAFVKIEKLERIDGQLGVEILREKKDYNFLSSFKEGKDKIIVYLPNSVINNKKITLWLDAFYSHKSDFIIITDPYDLNLSKSKKADINQEILKLSFLQNALILKSLRNYLYNFSLSDPSYLFSNNLIGIFIPDNHFFEKFFFDSSSPLSYEIFLFMAKTFEAKKLISLNYVGHEKKIDEYNVENFKIEELEKFV